MLVILVNETTRKTKDRNGKEYWRISQEKDYQLTRTRRKVMNEIEHIDVLYCT